MTDVNYELQIQQWLLQDEMRLNALKAVASLALPDCYIAAGFVRNLVWDRLHGNGNQQPLNDLDVIYFDATDVSVTREKHIEALLCASLSVPWSVKNQARMHLRNGDAPYKSTQDAIRFWCEQQTAVAARWNAQCETIELISGFGLQCLFDRHISLNPMRPKYRDFFRRISERRWLSHWPALSVNTDLV